MLGGFYLGQTYLGGMGGIPDLPPLPPAIRMIFAGIQIIPYIDATVEIDPAINADIEFVEPN